MSNFEILDNKLRQLIYACKETKNYKKMAVVSFVLISRRLDEMGVKLGLRPRDRKKDKGEKIYEYMRIINTIIERNFEIILIPKEIIKTIKEIEKSFVKNQGDIHKKNIIEIFRVYYFLRGIEVPNTYEQIDIEDASLSSDLNYYSLLSPKDKKSKKDEGNIALKSLLLQKIQEKQLQNKIQLQQNFSKENFGKAAVLKKLKESYKNDKNDKIVLKGTLKENMDYQMTLSNIVGYFLLGMVILFAMLGAATIYQIMEIPSFTVTLSPFIIIFFGSSMLLTVLYWNNFHEGD